MNLQHSCLLLKFSNFFLLPFSCMGKKRSAMTMDMDVDYHKVNEILRRRRKKKKQSSKVQLSETTLGRVFLGQEGQKTLWLCPLLSLSCLTMMMFLRHIQLCLSLLSLMVLFLMMIFTCLPWYLPWGRCLMDWGMILTILQPILMCVTNSMRP